MKTIIFVLEIRKSRGLGHWYRCLELVSRIREKRSDVRFVWLIDYVDDHFERELNENEVYFKLGDYRKVESIMGEVRRTGADLVIFDLMDLAKDLIVKTKRFVSTITIGGSGIGLSYSDISINGMFKREGFVENFYGEQLFIGVEYIILRSEIYKIYNKRILSNDIKRVFICLGADYEGKGLYIAKSLKYKYEDLSIDVLTHAKSERNDLSGIQIYKDVKDPWNLIKGADICISAGGMTAFESSYLGIPLLLISTTEIQSEACRKFQEEGLGLYAGQYGPDVRSQIMEKFCLMKSIELRRKIQFNGINMFQNNCRNLVSDIILKELK